MGIQRTPMPPDHWTPVRNAWLRDPRASLKAKGLIAYLMSHRVGYNISQAQIIRESTDGRTAVVAACEELEGLGYLQRTRAESSGGRFSEYDYKITDPFDADGNLLTTTSAGNPTSPPGTSAQNPTSAGNQPRSTSAGNPQRETAPIEEQREKTTSGLSDQTTQLALVAGDDQPTVGQRARTLAKSYHEKVDRMAPFMGVQNVVTLALKAGKWTDDQVAAALDVVADRKLTLTANVLRSVLNGATNGAGVVHQPYRDPATPAAYHASF